MLVLDHYPQFKYDPAPEPCPVIDLGAESGQPVVNMPPHSAHHNVVVAEHIEQRALQGFNLDPLIDRSDVSVSSIRLMSVRRSAGCHDQHPSRIHRLYTLRHNNFSYAAEVTDPETGDPEAMMVLFPGFTETIEGPIRQRLHDDMSYAYPQQRIVSFASDGVGRSGGRYGWNKRGAHSVQAMGRARLLMTHDLAGDLPTSVIGTSMGSKVLHHLVLENIDGPNHDALVLEKQFFLAPALVDPTHIVKDMGVRFLPEFMIDASRELVLKSTALEALKLVLGLPRYGLSVADGVALGVQLQDLLRGTPEMAIDETVAAVPSIVIAGEHDSLAQWPMWKRILARHPENLRLHVIANRGHGLPMKADNLSRKIVGTNKGCATSSL